MTIHSTHPFLDEHPDPARRLRGRLGGAVGLVTTHEEGLTVSSLMVAPGEPPRVVVLLDPDAELTTDLLETGHGVLQLLHWRHRQLSEAFAGQMPAPGGPFRLGAWVDTTRGKRLQDATTYAGLDVESSHEVGWSLMVVARLGDIVIGADEAPLMHRRGRYHQGHDRG